MQCPEDNTKYLLTTHYSGVMFEAAKRTWDNFTRDTKRAILAIMGLAVVLVVVVVATVSK